MANIATTAQNDQPLSVGTFAKTADRVDPADHVLDAGLVDPEVSSGAEAAVW
jgi:hypothetical protein